MPASLPVPAAALLAVRLERERRRRAVAEPSAATPKSVRSWAEAHRRINGQPFSLARFRPLEAIYDDDHSHIVIIKAAQRGVSEYAINLAMFALVEGARAWHTGHEGLNVGYLFPTKQAVSDFSKERVAGLKQESDVLRAMFGGYDDVTFKTVGRSYLYMRGAQSENDLHGFAADVLIRDEYDRQDSRARTLAEKRLNASSVRRILDLGTPVLPGQGIDAAYQQSDQRVWQVHCPACDGWHELPFQTTVVLTDAEQTAPAGWDVWQQWEPTRIKGASASVVCPECRAPLDHCGPGRWVALRPDVAHTRGYRVPWYGFPFVDLIGIAARLVDPDPTVVTETFRSDLGLPHVPKGAKVDMAMLANAGVALPSRPAWQDVTMGIDVGGRFHYRVSAVSGVDAQRYVIDAGSVAAWSDLSDLIRRWQVVRAVIDAHPELHACKAWQADHPDIVLRALYPTERALDGVLWREKDDDEGIININRTMAADALYAALSRGAQHPKGERWDRTLIHDREVQNHLTAPIRVLVTDDQGQSRATWTHTAPDHLFHASIYDRIASETLPGEGIYF